MKTLSTIRPMFSNPPSVWNRPGWFHLALMPVLTLLVAPTAFAQYGGDSTVTQTTYNTSGQSSFNSATDWSPSGAPSAGNNYYTAYQMRSPGTAATYVFGGDSLTINPNGYIQGKESGTEVLNFNNGNTFNEGLFLNGGGLYSGNNDSGTGVNILGIAGTITANAGTTSYLGAIGKGTPVQSPLVYEVLDMQGAIGGSGNLVIGGNYQNILGTASSGQGGVDDNGQLSGVVQFDSANTISGTVSVVVPLGAGGAVSAGIADPTLGLLDINNLNALQNAMLALNPGGSGYANVVSFNSAVNTGTFNVGALSGSANQALTDTAGGNVTLSVGSAGSSVYSGALSGGGSLIMAGSGNTLTLSGANTYTGTTTVSAGTLLVNGTHVGGGNYSVSGTLGGSGTITPGIGAGITINSGGILSPSAGVGISTLTLNGSGNGGTTPLLNLASGATLSYDLNTGLQSDQLAITGGAAGDVLFNNNVINFNDLSAGSLGLGQYILFSSDTANTYSGLTLSGSVIISGLAIGSGLGAYSSDVVDLIVSGNDIDLSITAVPEPSTVALGVCGGLLLCWRMKRRMHDKVV